MDKSPEAFRTISEVAEALATPAHVLRFWETRFPQIRPVKRAGGRRYYRPSDVALLAGIKRLLHDDGMTIRGVQKVLREQGVRHVAGLAEGFGAEDEALEATIHALVGDAGADGAADAADATAAALEAALEPEPATAEIVPLRLETRIDQPAEPAQASFAGLFADEPGPDEAGTEVAEAGDVDESLPAEAAPDETFAQPAAAFDADLPEPAADAAPWQPPVEALPEAGEAVAEAADAAEGWVETPAAPESDAAEETLVAAEFAAEPAAEDDIAPWDAVADAAEPDGAAPEPEAAFVRDEQWLAAEVVEAPAGAVLAHDDADAASEGEPPDAVEAAPEPEPFETVDGPEAGAEPAAEAVAETWDAADLAPADAAEDAAIAAEAALVAEGAAAGEAAVAEDAAAVADAEDTGIVETALAPDLPEDAGTGETGQDAADDAIAPEPAEAAPEPEPEAEPEVEAVPEATLAARLRALPHGRLSGREAGLQALAARVAHLRDRLAAPPGPG